MLLRIEWWNNHSCVRAGQYGDDGEMQCNACGHDFKREPIEELEAHVKARRLNAAALAHKALQEPPRPARTHCPWCGAQHFDIDGWETRPHHKHLCSDPKCGKLFRVEGEHGEYFYGA